MARTRVDEYTRTLANGTKVEVHGHQRSYDPAAEGDEGGWTPVQQIRRDRMREQARERRGEAAARGKAAAVRGWTATRRRGRQSLTMVKRGGKRLHRAGQLATRHKKSAAACLLVGGVAEIGAAVAWQGVGVLITTLSILGATLAGGLLLGGPKSNPTAGRRGGRGGEQGRDHDGRFADGPISRAPRPSSTPAATGRSAPSRPAPSPRRNPTRPTNRP